MSSEGIDDVANTTANFVVCLRFCFRFFLFLLRYRREGGPGSLHPGFRGHRE